MVDEVVSSQSNTLTWSDVENTAQLAFTKLDQPELEWGALEWSWQAWEILVQAGLATYSTQTQRNQLIIRFLALTALYLEFRSVALEEYVELDYYGWAKNLNFDHYDAAHYYAEEVFSFDSDWTFLYDEEYELDNNALQKLADKACKEVLSALIDSCGDIAQLFVFIWQSHIPEVDENGWVPSQNGSEILHYNIKSHEKATFKWLIHECSSKLAEETQLQQPIGEYLNSPWKKTDARALYEYRAGVKNYHKENYQEAINQFDQALQIDPKFAYGYCYRGRAKAKIGNLQGASIDYSKSLRLQPNQIEISNELGNIHYKLGNYYTAIQNYNWALDINPNLALVYYNRGRTYLKLEDKQRAIEDVRRAVELFELQGNIDNYEKAKCILKTDLLDYSEPSFTEICQNILSQGLRIAERTLRRYHLALKSRKFIVLSGISGTGKTWITKAYADAVEAEYLLVPVAPNWTTNEDLLGYLSPIDNKYHETDFSAFLEKAEEEYKQAQAEERTPKPYHLVLDEMNLARVEYYFAKFLSAMEVRMREGVAQIQLASEKQVLLPPNLYFIGTVNVDETTHSFADKVYDRAQLIELEAPRQDLYEHLGEVPYREILMQIWDEVHAVAPFAFRVLDEIKTYLKEAEALEVSWQNALDEQLLQKILPKLKGADDRVGVALNAFVGIVKEKDFPLSNKKATKMLETFNQHGFTSYF